MHFKNEEKDSIYADIDALLAAESRPDIDASSSAAIDLWRTTGRPKAVCAHLHGLNLNDAGWWDKPVDINDDIAEQKIDLIAGYKNPLVSYARAVAQCVQFPVNTTFLHALGILSSATIRHCLYSGRYGSTKHAGLYTVAAQPPSSGKSPTNDMLASYITNVINEQNEKSAPAAKVVQVELEMLEAEMKSKKTPAGERRHIAEELQKKARDLQFLQPYTWGVTDTTPEALEDCAAKQNGRFSIVSDEAEAVSVVFGVNYGNGKSQPNLGFMLKGFDGGQQLTLRMGRQGYRGEVVGAVAVLAQESTVGAILSTGRSETGSRGVCERFLILNEPNIIHQKNHRKHTPIPADIARNYRLMIDNILSVKEQTVFGFSDDATEHITQIAEGLQAHIADGGKFANELMRGVIGKAETQICKIATVLHIAKEYSPSGTKAPQIQADEVLAAANIYTQIIRSFVDVASEEGVAGEALEIRVAARKLKEIISNPKKPRSKIKMSDFSDSLRRTSPFSSIRGIRKHFKNNLMPSLQAHNYIVFDESDSTIHINPNLRD